ncbi:hypothetical protein SAMN02746000_00107 [Paracoccus sp. J56]|nr:hypothetical protein SAMN02746000_00107 [Paracoccus sp. J56]
MSRSRVTWPVSPVVLHTGGRIYGERSMKLYLSSHVTPTGAIKTTATPAYYGRDDDTKGCGVSNQRNNELSDRQEDSRGSGPA